MEQLPGSVDALVENRDVPREPNWLTGNPQGYTAMPDVTLASAAAPAAFPQQRKKFVQLREEQSEEGELIPFELTEQKEAEPLQQSDLLRPLLMDIARHGLNYAYEHYGGGWPGLDSGQCKQTERPRDVIVVGAGMAGMAAAYELRRVGHNVTILEAQDRVGGRVRTYDHKDGFKKGLFVDGKLPIHFILPANLCRITTMQALIFAVHC